MKAWLRLRRSLPLVVTGLLLGCGDGTSAFLCLPGTPTCECDTNGACVAGSTCVDNFCVASPISTGGSGGLGGGGVGATTTGGVGAAGAGATPTGGAGAAPTGGAGATPTGGAGAAETGGAPPTGGALTGGEPPTGGVGATGAGGTVGGALPTGGAPPTGGASAECTTATMDPCSSIPQFVGTQTVDGNDADVCSLPFFELNTDTADHVRVDHTGSESRPETASVRLGWSSAGLHAFITVTDPAVIPNSALEDIWDGDGIELMFASTGQGLTGNTGTDPATHASIAATPGVAASVQTVDANASASALSASSFQTTVVEPGYTIEVLLPWPGSAPSAGSQIAFDLALNSADDDPPGDPDGRDAQAILHLGSVGSSTCGDGGAEPWCDDRTWCTPTLE